MPREDKGYNFSATQQGLNFLKEDSEERLKLYNIANVDTVDRMLSSALKQARTFCIGIRVGLVVGF